MSSDSRALALQWLQHPCLSGLVSWVFGTAWEGNRNTGQHKERGRSCATFSVEQNNQATLSL